MIPICYGMSNCEGFMRYILFCLLVIFSTQVKSMDLNRFEELDETSQHNYLFGLMDGILFSQIAFTETKNIDDLICSPDTVAYSPDLARAAILTSKKKVDDPTLDIALYVIFGLKEMFPCE